MYKGKKIIALIPARGGSVSIPKKNVYPLCGTPLISYTTKSAGESSLLDAIYCSTNDQEIADVASSHPKCHILWRPDELCQNTSKTIDCVVHALKTLAERGECFDYLMILQPTSPLRTVDQIDGCIRYVIDHNLSQCVSVSRLHYLPVLMRYLEKDENQAFRAEHVVPGCGTCRRQDAKPTYYVDGSLYMYSTSEILEKGSSLSLNDAAYGYEIDADTALDINRIEDILFCEYILSKKENNI